MRFVTSTLLVQVSVQKNQVDRVVLDFVVNFFYKIVVNFMCLVGVQVLELVLLILFLATCRTERIEQIRKSKWVESCI